MNKRRIFNAFPPESGHDLEEDLLGKVNRENPAYKEAEQSYYSQNKTLVEKWRKEQGLSSQEWDKLMRDGFSLVESFPADDPIRPDKKLLLDLRDAFLYRLELPLKEEARVEIYSSVGSVIDQFGVDGFIKIRGGVPREKAIYLTLDLTYRDKQKTGADILMKNVPNPEIPEDSEKYDRALDEISFDLYRLYLRLSGAKNLERRTNG